MVTRITIEPLVDHARAENILSTLKKRFPKSRIQKIHTVHSYTIDASLSKTQIKKAAEILTNTTIESSSVNTVKVPDNFSYVVEIGFHPGVTDNVGNTAKEILENGLQKTFKSGDGVYSSEFVFFLGRLSKKEVLAFVDELHNPLIQRVHVFKKNDFKPRGKAFVPRVRLRGSSKATTVDLEVSNEELIRIGKEGIQDPDGTRRGPLALSLSEMQQIRDYFRTQGRNPTDIELESLAQTWSEHCKHTIFSDPLDDIKEGVYKRYIRGATEVIRKKKGKKDFCESVFVDNSGAIEFDDTYLVTHKVETHNSPSALDPFGGAITGIVGVNRDALGFGLGAKPIANIYGFCVGKPNDASVLYRGKNKERPLLSARYILEGVVRGINEGGNQSGIPTPLGFVATDDRYRGKPLVFAGTVGLLPKRGGGKRLSRKKAQSGDYVVMIGGKVGLDGIHGATFSSEALSSGSPATAVQIGDPITQKKLSDALIRDARDKGLYSSLTDNGAGGLSCSVAEMARECGGFEVDLETVPVKYPGLSPWQIWISESQERMTLSVPKKNWKTFKKIMDVHDVEATRIGTFNTSGKCLVRYKGKVILDVDMDFLHDGRKPQQQLSKAVRKRGENPNKKYKRSIEKALPGLLARPNIASYAFISDQYDHEVQGSSVTKPLHGPGRVNADAGIIKPIAESKKALVLSHGYLPWYSDLDAYHMAASSIDTAIRNAVVSGAHLSHLAILDNFCWSSGNTPERLYELKEATRACYETAVGYGTPFISGKDSMFNDFKGFDEKSKQLHVKIPPTLLISAISVIPDSTNITTSNFKTSGDEIYLLGETHEEFGGTEYVHYINDASNTSYLGERVPIVDVRKNKNIYKAFERANKKKVIASAISVGRGGLGVALAKAALGGQRGCEVNLKSMIASTKEVDALLFSESQGRILVSVPKACRKVFKEAMGDISYKKIGIVSGASTISVQTNARKKPYTWSLVDLKRAYQKPFKGW